MLAILANKFVHIALQYIVVIPIQKPTGGQKFIWKLNLDGFVCMTSVVFFLFG